MKKALIGLLVVAALGACTTIEYIDTDKLEDVLVINAQLNTADTWHTVVVSVSTRSRLEPLAQGRLDVLLNGAAVPVSLSQAETYNGTAFLFQAELQPGDVLELRAQAGTLSASATATVPRLPVLKAAEFVHNVPHSTSGSIFDGDYASPFIDNPDAPYPYGAWHVLKVTVQDLPGADSFYRISPCCHTVLTNGEQVEEQEWTLSPDITSEPALSPVASSSGGGVLDMLTETSNRYNVFTDELFKDKEYCLNLYIPERQLYDYRQFTGQYNYNEETQEWEAEGMPAGASYHADLRVHLYTISQHQYIYLKALDLDDMGMLFSEPVSIPSNVTGGLGFVTVDTQVTVTLDL